MNPTSRFISVNCIKFICPLLPLPSQVHKVKSLPLSSALNKLQKLSGAFPSRAFRSDCCHSQFQLGLKNKNMPTATSTRDISDEVEQHPVDVDITISVDGNISSGKSTLVDSLKELFPQDFKVPVELIPEPLEKWTDLKGHNLLEMFYQDPVKHNFLFQSYVQLTRLIETVKKRDDKEQTSSGVDGVDKDKNGKRSVRIMERSLQNNRYCFTELAKREGRLKPEEFAVLSEWYNWMDKNFDLRLDLIIYLRTSPETVFQRMQNRARAEEQTVPLEYLQKLHETYEDWLVNRTLGPGTPGKGAKLESNPSTSPQKLDPLELKELKKGGNDNDTRANANARQKIIIIDANKSKEEVALECQRSIQAFMKELGRDGNKDSASVTNAKRMRLESDPELEKVPNSKDEVVEKV